MREMKKRCEKEMRDEGEMRRRDERDEGGGFEV